MVFVLPTKQKVVTRVFETQLRNTFDQILERADVVAGIACHCCRCVDAPPPVAQYGEYSPSDTSHLATPKPGAPCV